MFYALIETRIQAQTDSHAVPQTVRLDSHLGPAQQ